MEFKYCANCVMDGSAKELVLDESGVCNFCKIAQRELKMAKEDAPNLQKWLDKIKKDGEGKEYDCLIGLSGGADSSTMLHHAVNLGLRPLTYSMDNGYNDPKADENIMRLVEGLRVPFTRVPLNLGKFRELQSAFIKAGLPNIEIPTDHILTAVAYQLAVKYKIRWILSGGNVATESIMPPSWSYNARDLKHIKAVYKWAKGEELRGIPTYSLWQYNWYKWIKGIRTFYLLDYVGYNLKESKEMLAREYLWQDYYEKHCENLFTWWFQSYYLFEKFGIDKRKAHYSSLINSGQMTRKEAVYKLSSPPEYPDMGTLQQYAMAFPKRQHADFPTDKWYDRISKFVRLWKF